MKTKKLREVLNELLEERKMLDRAISSLEQVIAQLDSHTNSKDVDEVSIAEINRIAAEPTYVELAESVLQKHGKPMNIKDLTFEVEKLRGRSVQRSSLEGTIFRHIQAKKDRARIIKVGPAIYALPTWPHSTKNLWPEAVTS